MSTVAEPGLAHVALSVTDLARANQFYLQVLGLRELPRPELGIPGTWLAAGPGMIHLAEVAAIPDPRDPIAHFALQVPTDRLAPLADAVRDGGGCVVFGPTTREDFGSSVTSVICADTEGNRFELTDAGAPAHPAG